MGKPASTKIQLLPHVSGLQVTFTVAGKVPPKYTNTLSVWMGCSFHDADGLLWTRVERAEVQNADGSFGPLPLSGEYSEAGLETSLPTVPGPTSDLTVTGIFWRALWTTRPSSYWTRSTCAS